MQFAEGNDLGSGRGDLPEELETDGPVMGGPGMMRTGADRAISTGTGGLAAGEDLDPVAEGVGRRPPSGAGRLRTGAVERIAEKPEGGSPWIEIEIVMRTTATR